MQIILGLVYLTMSPILAIQYWLNTQREMSQWHQDGAVLVSEG